MITLIKEITTTFKDYSGSSIIMLLFVVSLIYLYFSEEDKGKRSILIYGSICLLVLFFCPILAYLVMNVIFNDNEVYYRMLWLLPVNTVVAYSGVKLINTCKGNIKKILLGTLFILIIGTNGSYVYSNPTFLKAENSYHLPDEVIEVCDAILPKEEGKWVCAVFPKEMISFVRQYSSRIYMPYGRAVLIDRWNLGHLLYDLMEEETINSEVLSDQATDYGCEYIILAEGKNMTVSLENYNYKKVDSVAGYQIFKRIKE